MNFFSKLIVVFVIIFLDENFRLATIPFTWWAWLSILFAVDLCYYWAQRIGHESRFFLGTDQILCIRTEIMRGFSLFDTFQPELKEEKVVYGLHSNIYTYIPIKIAFHK